MNGAAEQEAVAPAPRRRRPVVGVAPILAILLLQLGLAYLALGAWYTLSGNDGWNRARNPIGVDFVQYYAASGLALAGDAVGVYDHDTLFAAEDAVIEGDPGRWPWSYPPTFLLVILPFAKLPYLWALGVWLAAGLAALLYVGWRLAPHPLTPLLVLAYPAVGNSLFAGQNGCLSAALLGGGLLALERRPWLAGLLFGLLSYKPQLGLLLPLALIAGGYGRAFAGAALTTLAFAALSLAVFGPGPWQAFIANLGFMREVFEKGYAALENMPTWFAFVRLLGGPHGLAYLLQVAGLLAAAGFVVWLWRRPLRFELKAAGLLFAIPLTTPYAQFYDLAALALGLLWLCAVARDCGWRPGEQAALSLLWVAPVALWLIAFWLGLQLWPLLLSLLLVLVARRVLSPGRRTASSSPSR